MTKKEALMPDSDQTTFTTYEAFVAAVEDRPSGVSPLMWMTSLPKGPQGLSGWMLRWLRAPKSTREQSRDD